MLFRSYMAMPPDQPTYQQLTTIPDAATIGKQVLDALFLSGADAIVLVTLAADDQVDIQASRRVEVLARLIAERRRVPETSSPDSTAQERG